MRTAHASAQLSVARCRKKARRRKNGRQEDRHGDRAGARQQAECAEGTAAPAGERSKDEIQGGRKSAVENPVRKPSREAQKDGERREPQRPRGAALVEGAVDCHEQQRVRDRDGALHPEAPRGLAGREGPRGGAACGGEVRKAPAPEKGIRGEEREVELEKQNRGLDPGLRYQEGRKKGEGRKEALGEMEGADRSRRHPGVPEQALRKVPKSHQRRLAGGRRIRQEAVLGLDDAVPGHAPGVMGAHEVVRGEDTTGHEQRGEEDEVEGEKRREAVALQEARPPARATMTRKYESTQPLSRRWSSRAIRRDSAPVWSSRSRAMSRHGNTNHRMLPP